MISSVPPTCSSSRSGPASPNSLGFGYGRVHQHQPALVYCSISGYGQEGPWRDRPGFDCLVAAKLGVMAEQDGHGPAPSSWAIRPWATVPRSSPPSAS